MEVAPLQNEFFSQSFQIKEENNIYELNTKVEDNQNIVLNISEKNGLFKIFETKINFEELKLKYKAFTLLDSLDEFIEFIKIVINNNKLFIKKEDEEKLIIEIIIEYLYKQSIVKFDLKPKNINPEICVKDAAILGGENKEIKSQNEALKGENEIFKEEIKDLKNKNSNLEKDNHLIDKSKYIIVKNRLYQKNEDLKIDSSIIKSDEELYLIKNKIERLYKSEIKKINLIYKATVDGGEPIDFHKKCDGISNTLVLYETKGNRRFGGFASESWENESLRKKDDKCFIFSLDKKKIFNKIYKEDFFIYSSKKEGPGFGDICCYIIKIEGNAIENKSLTTGSISRLSVKRPVFLSECGIKGTRAKEIEVFQILLS